MPSATARQFQRVALVPGLSRAIPELGWENRQLVALLRALPGEQGGDFDIVSYGKDAQPGGSGDAEDITNH